MLGKYEHTVFFYFNEGMGRLKHASLTTQY